MANAFLFPLLAACTALCAQQPASKPKPAPAAEAPKAGAATPAATPQEIPLEELLMAKPTPYRPGLVRDPVSAPSDAEQSSRGDLVDDVGVKGRVISGGRALAVVSDSRGNTRMLPVGYRFRDGEIAAISETAVTFRQWDVAAGTRSVFRTVVKPFKREEGKR